MALVALFAATTGGTAFGVLALDTYGIINMSPARTSRLADRVPQRLAADEEAAVVKVRPVRFAQPHLNYVPATALPLRLASYTEEPESETASSEDPQTSDGDGDDTWSAEIRSEAKSAPATQAPRVTGPSPALPLAGHTAALTASLQQRLTEISPGASERLRQKFGAAVAGWPPSNIALVAIKDEKALDLYARPAGGKWKFIYRYPVLAESGVSGPKLRQGDKQVPEGIYGISLLNPNSRYHVSMRVNYPNAFDKQMAALDGRANLGGDIMIHGKNASAGCLAMGDETSEELFVLANKVGLANIKVIIAPTDFRKNGMPAADEAQPKWVPTLYKQVASAMSEFEAPPSSGLLSFFWK